jgi:methylmalonyl-CoA/ethylmalonyl-CoA epimerase
MRAEVDHVTVIVPDADATQAALSKLLGVEPSHSLALPGMAIRTFRLGDVELHVNAPTGPGPVKDFFERSGNAAYHHVALRVQSLDEALERAGAAGFRTLGAPVETAPGLREVFLDPRTTGGVMLQLVERREVATSELDASAIEALVSQVGSPVGEPRTELNANGEKSHEGTGERPARL